jgi:hypothetical protein
MSIGAIQCLKCHSNKIFKIDWNNIDLDYECSQVSSMAELAEKLGCSDVALKKRMLKVNFDRSKYFKLRPRK